MKRIEKKRGLKSPSEVLFKVLYREVHLCPEMQANEIQCAL